jgi:hypothetical protein
MFTCFLFMSLVVLALLVLRGAPSPGTRGTPTGYRLPDGFKSFIAFSGGAKLWEIQVKPPGFDSGDPIDISTMFNTRWHTMFLRQLVKMEDCTGEFSYDPGCIGDFITEIGILQTITCVFPDGSTIAFFGGMRKAEFAELKEGEFPKVTVTFTVTNYDVAGNVEAGPFFTQGSGTAP